MPLLEIIFSVLVAGFLFVYWVLAFIILYHLARFGVGIQPKRFAVIFLLGSVVLSGATIILFMNIDINQLISLIPR